MTQPIAPEQLTQVANAFDRKALVYDHFGTDHVLLSRMRQQVYDHICAVRQPGDHLLELNAGTGTDAVALVERGFRIHATDLAPQMIAQIEEKIGRNQLQSHLTTQQCSFTDLDQVHSQFDGVYSNFGGLNCIPDLRAVTRHLPALLRPNGTVTFVIMPRICPWEMALLPKDWRVATRRWRRHGVRSNVEGVSFTTYYFSVRQAIAAFGSAFSVEKLEALALTTPTADNKTFAIKHPKIYHRLTQLDDALRTRSPFNRFGDFFILTMRYWG